jgi:hypothetical protein
VVAHRDVVRMIVKMNIWDRDGELVFLCRVERYTVGLLWHVFAHQRLDSAASYLRKFAHVFGSA